METKIVQWIHCDNKIKEYNNKSKPIKELKDKLGLEIMNEIDIFNKTKDTLPKFNIQSLNTSIIPQINNSYEGYTNKFLTKCYSEYFNSEARVFSILISSIRLLPSICSKKYSWRVAIVKLL